MQLLPWLPADAEGLLVYAGMLLVWAEALYVLTRSRGGTVPALAALGMGTFSIYLLGLWAGALESSETSDGWVSWLRYTFWSGPLTSGLWLSLVLVLAGDETPGPLMAAVRRRRTAVLVAVITPGLVLGLLGASGDSILRWSDVFRAPPLLGIGASSQAWHVPVGTLFSIFQVYLLVTLSAAVGVLVWSRRSHPGGTPLHARFGGLLACGVLFLLGGGYLGVASAAFHASALPGELLLIAGMIVMGWNVAHYGALLSGEVSGADFRAFAVSTLALVGLYVALLLLLPASYAWAEATRLLLLAVMTTHVLADHSAALMDQLLFEPRANALRRRLRALADRAVRQPDPITALVEVREGMTSTEPAEDEVRMLLESALRHLNDLPGLTQHGLIGHTPSTVDADVPPTEAAALLRSDLLQAIERLRPDTPRPGPGNSTGPGGWLHFLVLHEAYVDGRPNKQIMQRYYLSESSFHRARRRAVDTLALDLHERMLRRSPTATRAALQPR